MMILSTGIFKKKNSGFTLVEMLAVVVIIALVFSVSIPNLAKTARGYYFDNKAKTLEALLEYLCKSAALKQRKQKLVLDFANDDIRIYIENIETEYPDYMEEKRFFSLRQSFGQELDLKGTTDYEQELSIFFDPSGSISNAEFYLVSDAARTARFKTSLSGQIIVDFI